MEEKMKVVQKNSKQFQCFLKIILVLIAAAILFQIGIGIFCMVQKEEAFEVVESKDKFGFIENSLKINGKHWYNITLDNGAYQTNIETGLPNYKASTIIDVVITIINSLFVFAILFLVQKMNGEIVKEVKPFAMKNVKRLRGISILILLQIFIPTYLELLITMVVFFRSQIIVPTINIMMLFLSLTIWGISYIVEYGYVLQTEVDELI